MATHVLTDAALWLHDVAVHDLANTLEFSTSRETQDSTVFGGTARTMKPGLFVVQASASGFADFSGFDADLFEIYDGGTAVPVTCAATTGDGDVAYFCQAVNTQIDPLGGSIGDLAAVSVAAAGARGVRPIRGNILAPEAARTVSGNGAARQLGAVSATQSVYAALHVLAASGSTPTLDVIVQSDDAQGMATPTTRLTFAQATGKTSQFVSAAGAVTDNWWRVSWTIGGTTPSFTFIVAVGIAAT